MAAMDALLDAAPGDPNEDRRRRPTVRSPRGLRGSPACATGRAPDGLGGSLGRVARGAGDGHGARSSGFDGLCAGCRGYRAWASAAGGRWTTVRGHPSGHPLAPGRGGDATLPRGRRQSPRCARAPAALVRPSPRRASRGHGPVL